MNLLNTRGQSNHFIEFQVVIAMCLATKRLKTADIIVMIRSGSRDVGDWVGRAVCRWPTGRINVHKKRLQLAHQLRKLMKSKRGNGGDHTPRVTDEMFAACFAV